MSKMNALLSSRFKSAANTLSKMTHLATLSSSGNLSSFSGVFQVTPLNSQEKLNLEEILNTYETEDTDISCDLEALLAISAEVKAINNQAVLLHGERIKRAQIILKNYRDGAFSAWLIATYGNRQTPYNFLQYYELHLQLPQELHPQLEAMPRQAVYSLASREGPFEQKKEIIASYQGEPKQTLLNRIRDIFPLGDKDARAQDMAEVAITTLKRLHTQLSLRPCHPSKEQKKALSNLLKALKALFEEV